MAPLKAYIAKTYGDPEKYNEECNTLNRLRQDMRGAGKDSAAGRDLLYRYYGQLELLDLRFPVEERGVKVGFTWYVISCSGIVGGDGADFSWGLPHGYSPSGRNVLTFVPST